MRNFGFKGTVVKIFVLLFLSADFTTARNLEIKNTKYYDDENSYSQLNLSYMALHSNFNEVKEYFSKQKYTISREKTYGANTLESDILTALNYRLLNSKTKEDELEAQKVYEFFIEQGLNINASLVPDNRNVSVSNLMGILSNSRNSQRQAKVINFLISKGLDAKAPCFVSDDCSPNLYAPAIVVSENLSVELFKIFAQKGVKADLALEMLVNLLVDDKLYSFIDANDIDGLNLYLKSDRYKAQREKYKPYIYEIFKNYSIDDFDESELILSTNAFITAGDTKFVALVANAGLEKKPKLLEKFVKFAEKLGNQEIVKILKLLKI